MKYLLDSNIIIRLSMGIGGALRERAAQCEHDELVTSSIVLAEVAHGSNKGRPPTLDRLRSILEEVPVLDFDYKAALAYASLPFKRGSYDRLIAAHALSHDLVLVTDNERDFADVPGLKIENWTI